MSRRVKDSSQTAQWVHYVGYLKTATCTPFTCSNRTLFLLFIIIDEDQRRLSTLKNGCRRETDTKGTHLFPGFPAPQGWGTPIIMSIASLLPAFDYLKVTVLASCVSNSNNWLTCLFVHSNCQLLEQGGWTQKSSSLESRQSWLWSHTRLYETCSMSFLHVNNVANTDLHNAVTTLSLSPLRPGLPFCKQADCISHARSSCV